VSPAPPAIGYLGPAGSYSYDAARRFRATAAANLRAAPLVAFRSLDALGGAVRGGAVRWAALPLRNSLSGPVREAEAALRGAGAAGDTQPLVIVDQQDCAIEHALLLAACPSPGPFPGPFPGPSPGGPTPCDAATGTVAVVFSKAEALEQCAPWLDTHLPGALRVPVSSTSFAAKLVSRLSGRPDPPCAEDQEPQEGAEGEAGGQAEGPGAAGEARGVCAAAIASRGVGRRWGLSVRCPIQTPLANVTTFALVRAAEGAAEGGVGRGRDEVKEYLNSI
jgi:prephenate dehydratase